MKPDIENLLLAIDDVDEQLRQYFIRQDELNTHNSRLVRLKDVFRLFRQGYFRFYLTKTKRVIQKRWKNIEWVEEN